MTGPNPYRTAFLAAIAIAVLGIAAMIGYLCFVNDAHATVLADPALDPGAIPEVETGPAQPTMAAAPAQPTMAAAPAQPSPATGGPPWEVWLAIGIAALAGIETIVRGMRAVLGLIAPRTKTTLDDAVLAKLDRLDEEIMHVLSAVRGRGAPPAPPQREEPDPDPTEHSRIGSVSRITTGSGIVCLIIALGVGVVQPACATTRPRIAAGVGAALDCNAPGLVGTFAGALVLAASAVESWIAGDGTIDAEKLVTAASKLKSDQERCALATALAIAATPSTPDPDAPASAPLEVDAAAMLAAFTRVKAQWGVLAVATEGGVI